MEHRKRRENLLDLREGLSKYDREVGNLGRDISRVSRFYTNLEKEHSDTFKKYSHDRNNYSGRVSEFSVERTPVRGDSYRARQSRFWLPENQYGGALSGGRRFHSGSSADYIITAAARKPRNFDKSEIPVWTQEKYRSIERQYPKYTRNRYEPNELRSKEQVLQKSMQRSGLLFSGDPCRLAILQSISMAWTADKYKENRADWFLSAL